MTVKIIFEGFVSFISCVDVVSRKRLIYWFMGYYYFDNTEVLCVVLELNVRNVLSHFY